MPLKQKVQCHTYILALVGVLVVVLINLWACYHILLAETAAYIPYPRVEFKLEFWDENSSSITTSLQNNTYHKTESIRRHHTANPLSLSATATTQLDTNPTTSNQSGNYLLAISFWDQQTYSVGNILSLQCWSAYAKIPFVVEPFMIGSKFGMPINAHGDDDTTVPLSLLYDLKHWNTYSSSVLKYSPLVPWNYFLSRAPREILFVEIPPISSKSCSLVYKTKRSSVLYDYNFRFVKELCIKYDISVTKNRKSLDNFTDLVFNNHVNYSTDKITVLFTEWSGSTVSSFVDLESCTPQHSSYNVIAPSQTILSNAREYIYHELGGEGRFIAVMLRMEWMFNIYPDKLGGMVTTCLNKTLKRLQAFQDQTRLYKTFVAIDVGKYGSKTNKRLGLDVVVRPVTDFLKAVYGNSTSLTEWEMTFERHSVTRNPGYIGFLQKVIATKARCLLLTGYGTFQKHALSMYKAQHMGQLCYAFTDLKCQIKSREGIELKD